MNDYIDNLPSQLQEISLLNKLHLVLGNESCDLDSVISSIVLAYFLNSYSKHNEDIFLPVLQINADDLPLKTEVTHVLNKSGVKLGSLLCQDDLDMKSMPEKCQLRLILVDNHILSDKFSILAPYVTKILDHRPKDEASWKYDDTVSAKIETVGSCATLVCSEIVNHVDGNKFLNENKDVANLLYGTIILDTANFLPSADRARPLDFEMVDTLEKILKIEKKDEKRSSVFDELLKARTNCSALNSLQLLNRDLKIVNGMPLPGLPMLAKEFLNRIDCESACKTFCERNETSTILIIGLIVVDNCVMRDLAVYSVEECDLHRSVVTALTTASQPCLELEKTTPSMENCDHFIQNNVKASRKQIVPIVKKLLS